MTRDYPWRFMGFLVLANLVPQLYTLFNLFWIGRISAEAFAITEQNEFIELAIEVLMATIPLGALALIARHHQHREKVIAIIKAGLIMQVALALMLTALIVCFAERLPGIIGTPDALVHPTRTYLVLRALTIPCDMAAYMLLIAIKSLHKGREAFLLVALSIGLNILLDLFLISTTPLSLHLGLPGVVLAYFVTQIVLMVIAAVYLFSLLQIDGPTLRAAAWRREVVPLWRIGGWSGLETAIRMIGVAWILMMLNGIGADEYGGFGIATWIFWILLMPFFAITQGTSILVGNYAGAKRYGELTGSMKISLLLVMGYSFTVVATGTFWWRPVSLFLNPNPAIVDWSVASFSVLIFGFVGFGVGNVLRSIFYGTGQTRYVFYLGIITNFGIILPFFLLVQAGIIVPTFAMVMMVYLAANLIDPLLAGCWARKVVRALPA